MDTHAGTASELSPTSAAPHQAGLHGVVWLAWATAAAASVQLAPSPVYVAVVVAVAWLVVEAHAQDTPLARAFPALVALGVVFGLVRVVLTVLTTHGVGEALVTVPDATVPRALGGFTVGGTIELPVLLRAGAESFAIVGVMAAFGAFNAVVSHHELVQAAPRAFYEPGLVVTVALAFVPSTLAVVHAVREADRARTGGAVVRRGRLLRLTIPILETGIERAVALAESMDSRGFAHGGATAADRKAAWAGLASLGLLGASFVALVGRAGAVAGGLAAAGTAALAAAVALASTGARRTRYRPRRMSSRDWRFLAVAAVAPAVLAGLAFAGDGSLVWDVVPLRLPAFNPLAGAGLLFLALPAVLVPRDAR